MAEDQVEVRPIFAPDIAGVAQFLHDHMNARVGADAWRQLMTPPWADFSENRGFQLVLNSVIVGAYVAVYSRRMFHDGPHAFCNLAAFYVLPEHRSHALRLYRAVLGQRGYEFTDLSPSGNVVKLNDRMGFKRLDNPTTLALNVLWRRGRSIKLSEDPDVIESALDATDLVIFADHRMAAASRHLIVRSGDVYAYLMYRRDRRKRLPVFASPLYVGGSRELLESAWPAVGGYLLIRHGMVATLADHRVLGFEPRGIVLDRPRPKMYRSKTLNDSEIDYLYSELTLLEW